MSRLPSKHCGLQPLCHYMGKEKACRIDVFPVLESEWFSLVTTFCRVLSADQRTTGAGFGRFLRLARGMGSGVGSSWGV